MRVAVCVPVARNPTYQFWRSLQGLKGAASWRDVRGHEVHEARRILTETALSDHEVTHLLFIDDDMQFPADALERLLAHDVPIVGGLCHARRPPWNPMLARRQASNGLYTFEYNVPVSGLVEVDATGAAFLLVKREVFESMFEYPDTPDWWKPSPPLTEDFSFCVRAKAAGYKVLVDVGLDIGHVAEVVVDRKTAAQLRGEAVARPAPSNWRQKTSAFLPGVPRASIIIPTYNQDPELLSNAVRSALDQSVPVEVIVVDDGGSDGLVGWAGAKLIRHPENYGIAAALNTGLRAMTTEWFCWLSSDDTIAPVKVEIQLSELIASGAKCGFHDYDVAGRTGHMPVWRNLAEQQAMLSRDCVINGSTVMIHRSVFEDVGTFDPAYKYGQDWEFWCRVSEKYLWHLTPRVLGTRHEGGNLTQLIAAEAADSPRRKRRDEEDAKIRARYAR